MYLIIVDPKAGRGLSILRLPVLKSVLDSKKIPYEVYITAKPGDGYAHTLTFLSRNSCIGVIGLGSDSVMQEIVTGMVDAYPEVNNGKKIPVPLCMLPTGSCNDLITTLEGVKYNSVARYRSNPFEIISKFVDRALSNKPKPIDVITVAKQAFINVGCVGMDVKIAVNAKKYREKIDRFAYLLASLEGVFKYESISLAFETENDKVEGRFTLLAVCNGQYYGFGARISPGAVIDDGIMNLTVVDTMPGIKALINVGRFLWLNHQNVKRIKFYMSKELKLDLPATTLCLDGNFYPIEKDVSFKVLPRVLDIHY